MGRGVQEKVLENMDEVETNLNNLVVQKYLAEQGDLPEALPDMTGYLLPVPMQRYCVLYFVLVTHS